MRSRTYKKTVVCPTYRLQVDILLFIYAYYTGYCYLIVVCRTAGAVAAAAAAVEFTRIWELFGCYFLLLFGTNINIT